jgi:acetyltransferase-like isoleucine patch superfamily enzyme
MRRGQLSARLLDPYLRVRFRGAVTRPYWRLRFHAFGRKSILYRPEFIFRPWQMSVGDETMIMHHAWLEIGAPAWAAEEPVLRIGDDVSIRSHVTISAAESVVIEDHVLIAAYTGIYDSDHTLRGPWNPVWNHAVTAPVRIGRGSWIGERVAVLRGADIGEGCIIGANSVVKGSIPDHSIAVGAPARVVGPAPEWADQPVVS